MGKNKNKNRNKRKRENNRMLLLNGENVTSKTSDGLLPNFSNDVERCDYQSDGTNSEQDYLTSRTVALNKTSIDCCQDGLPSGEVKHGARPKVKILNPKNTHYFSENCYFDDSSVDTENIYTSVKKYEENSHKFRQAYIVWRKGREGTIEKLKTLRNRVHFDQLLFNKTNLLLKEVNVGSRKVKSHSQSIPLNFMASIATLVTDAVGGVTSVAQAFNVDGYMQTFCEIMEHDVAITKPLYDSRSLCLKQYHNVEEVVRTFHSNSFGNTVGKISEALNLEELTSDIKYADGDNDATKFINGVDAFFKNNSATEIMENIYDSIQNCVSGNPAVLDACGSVGKVFYDVYDIWGPSLKFNKSMDCTKAVGNRILLYNEMMALEKLRSIANNSKEKVQAKLESDIFTAISMLQAEMMEISKNVEEIDYSNGKMDETDLWCD